MGSGGPEMLLLCRQTFAPVPFCSILQVDAWLLGAVKMNSDEEEDLLFNRNRAGWKTVRLAPEERTLIALFCHHSF